MKNSLRALAAIVLLTFMSSCGVGYAYVFNHNQNATQVHLAENNFNVVDKVSGSAEVSYVLIFGGMSKSQLYKNAYEQMVKEAELTGSKALINVLTEEHVGGIPPFYYKRTITVSANVVEFVN